ncbi:transcription initiation protein SPT3 homolog [Dendronephthya gigantea]|uniref:transcription initiation protein SPT3 homolog n=1 Tax=Dendronephthya gigantea TaxID=151771 RepID=UPI00106C6345|nr:transcription initiation protein SPT3 homolog [Dendronephthya gigantea]
MTKAKQKPKKPAIVKEETSVNNETKVQAVDALETNAPTNQPEVFQPPQISQNSRSTAAKPWFQTEILSMMYAFGDARRPSSESARLIEGIVHQQISKLVVQTAEVTALRGGKFMHTEDIKFLMRKDKDKLRKLNQYLSFKESKQKLIKQVSQEDDEILGSFAGNDAKAGNKRRRLSDLGTSDFKDDSGLLGDDSYDHRRDRLERAERLSRTLDTQQYLEFVECRQANFNKKAGKFKEWLDYSNLTDLKPNSPVMEVFSYLAYETVGQIVDLALLVKKDMERGDELSAVMPLLRQNNASKINLPFISTPSLSTSRSSTPTPPGTPTTPTGNAPPSFPNTGGAAGSGATVTSSNTTGINSSSLVTTSKSSKSKKKKAKLSSMVSSDLYSDCLQPEHIREAMRRYCSSVGPMAPFAPYMKTTPTYRTLCL